MKLSNTSFYVGIFSLLLSLYIAFALSEPCKHRTSMIGLWSSNIIVPTKTHKCFHWWKLQHDEPHNHSESSTASVFEAVEWRKRKKYR